MHELSLLEGMLERIEEAARTQGFTRVHRVILALGRLSGADPESLRFCFQVATADTLAQGAELEIRDIPGAGWCPACGREVPLETRFDPCPDCGGVGLPVTAGGDMKLEALDVA